LSGRERTLKALNHEAPDRVPVDLGTTNCTTMTRVAYENLKKLLGVEKETRLMMENFQIAFIDEEVLEILGIDTRGVHPQPVFQKKVVDERTYYNEFGIKYRMPEGGLYYDMVEHPLAGVDVEGLKDYPWPDPAVSMDLRGVRERAQKLHEEGKYLLVGDMIDTGIFEPCWYLRGFENFLVDLVVNRDFALQLMEGMYQYQLQRYSLFLREVGEFLDVIFVGDDLATAESVIMNPKTYRNGEALPQRVFCESQKACAESQTPLPFLWEYCPFHPRFNRGGGGYFESGAGFSAGDGYEEVEGRVRERSVFLGSGGYHLCASPGDSGGSTAGGAQAHRRSRS